MTANCQNEVFDSGGGSIQSSPGGYPPPHMNVSLFEQPQSNVFWRYGTQTRRLDSDAQVAELTALPRNFLQFSDPVFDDSIELSEAAEEGLRIRHEGRPRKGDATEMNPSSLLLLRIGRDLSHLQRQQDQYPLKDRTTKNKFASRICRLKKRAQVEANKILYFGMQNEHQCKLNQIQELESFLGRYLRDPDRSESPSAMFQTITGQHRAQPVHMNNDAYITSILTDTARNSISVDQLSLLQKHSCSCSNQFGSPAPSTSTSAAADGGFNLKLEPI